MKIKRVLLMAAACFCMATTAFAQGVPVYGPTNVVEMQRQAQKALAQLKTAVPSKPLNFDKPKNGDHPDLGTATSLKGEDK
ncbi:hypothetical protein [uncultured Tateyamaria sp.]|uniref:hypothetical protein n=1 Tax=uncultured Tateyamaria sp. TaxID=455651 RepID=UPI002616BD4F|nr:hypothetical protein [uncultured Tateyamaria sp.]